MLGIALSLPVAVFINRFIFQVTIFNFINYISIFVILGIAADDVFVFTDCWKQSATFSQLKEEGDTKIDWLRKRMNYTWRRTSKAILTTSLTTCMSFLATGFSKLLPISAFGFFSAMFVMMLYVFTITIYPCCIILFDKYLVNRWKYCPYIRYLLLWKCCCHRSKDSEKENEDASENDSEKFESPVKKVPYISRPNGDNPSGHSVRQSDGYDTKPKTKGSSNNPSENNKEEEDHDGGEDSQNPNNISRRISHEIENEIDKGRKETKANDDEPEIEELTPIEKFFRNYWNSWMNKFKFLIFAVTIIWVSFAIWRVTRFKTAKNPIQRLESDHPLEVLDHMVQNDFHSALNTGKIEVSFVWGLEGLDKKGVGRWDPTNLGKLIYDDTFNLAPEANQQRLLDICADLRNQDLVENRVVTWWIEDFVATQGGGSPVSEASFYTQLQAYISTSQGNEYYTQNLIGYFDGKLHFTQIVALTPEAPFQGRKILHPIYGKWEKLVDSYNNGSPEGLNKAFQTSGYHWAWLETENEMVRGVIVGIVISLCFAFLVLVFSTLNIMIALYAVLSISVIVTSVIAVMELNSWGLGVIEAIATVMIIGFSVDYVVHLGNHYVECPFDSRYQRMQEALASIGISIVSGAITTIASGIFLFAAVIIFFTKFAVLVVSTICFSIYCSLFLFTSLNHFIGPEKHFGDLKYYIVSPLWKKIKEIFNNWRSKAPQPESNPEHNSSQEAH